MKKLASLVLAIVLTLSVCIVGAAMAEGNTIYVLGPTPDHGWTAQAGAYAQAKCEEITAEGTYKATYIPASSGEEQVDQINTIIANNDAAIVVMMALDDSAQAGQEALYAEGIPFISFDRIIEATEKYAALNYSGNNWQCGAGIAYWLQKNGMKPGDTVVMEEPVHPDMSRAMELAGAKILTVPVDQDGMRVDLLEKLILHKHPRFIFVNSSFHDPTGYILSLERRKKIIEISNTYRVPIVEEDAASELVYEGEKLPPIKAFDTLENVIYIYSFSLTFVTGLSIAVVAANADVIRSLSYLVSVRLMASDWMTQKLLGRYLDDGTYYKALDEFRASYRRKQRLVCEKLDEMAALGVSYERPRGGVYIWCRLPDGVDSKRFINRAYNMGLILIPGYVFYPFKNGGRNYVRINYSYESDERLLAGMEVFRAALLESLEG